VFPATLEKDRQSAMDWGTSEGGGMLSAGIGGGINGEGAGLLIVDDLIKNSKNAQSESFRDDCWDWFRSTAWTRLSPGGVCVAIGTPWHRDDHLARIKREFGDDVLEISFPAIAEKDDDMGREPGRALWPDRWDENYLEKQRDIEGPYFWNALYQLRPTIHEDAEWGEEYFEGIYADHWPERFDISTVSVDPSASGKGDYTGIVFAGLSGGIIYVDSNLVKRPASEVVPAAFRMAVRNWSYDVVFEASGFQSLLKPEYDRYQRNNGKMPIPASMIEHHGINKEIRIRRLGGYLASKRIKIKRESSHNELLIQQMKEFPLSDHDDGPDALEMAIRRLNIMARDVMQSTPETQLVP